MLLPEMTFLPVVMTLIPMVMTFLSAVIMFAPTVITILSTVRMFPAMMMTFDDDDDDLTCSITFSPLNRDGNLFLFFPVFFSPYFLPSSMDSGFGSFQLENKFQANAALFYSQGKAWRLASEVGISDVQSLK